jgi:predicted dehydrogenase
MMRHLKRCIGAGETPVVGPAEGLVLMQVMDAIYKSAETGRSVEIKSDAKSPSPQLSPLGTGETE